MAQSSQQVWAQFHEEAFRYFGGAVSYIVLDNLKEEVVTPDLYEPEIARSTDQPAVQRHARAFTASFPIRHAYRVG